jgi:HK97 family phage prohead protease
MTDLRPDRSAEFRMRLKILKNDNGKPRAPLGRAAATSAQRREYRLAQHGVRELRPCPTDYDWEVRGVDSGDVLTFEGWPSITNRFYDLSDAFGEYREIVTPGAFAKTLGNRAPVVLNVHHEGLALASTRGGNGTPGSAGYLQLREITEGSLTGLHATAWLDRSRPDVRMVESAIRTGAADSMSFAFRVSKQRWLNDETERHIDEVNLSGGDVSIISSGQAASDHTAGLVSVRSKPVTLVADRGPRYRKMLAELRKG